MTSFHTYISRSEVGVHFPLFTHVLTGVRQHYFAIEALVGVKLGSDVSISDVCGGYDS
jgi:hypothetical protein